MALTNVAIANRLGTILPAPNQVAVTSTGPTTGDIGADGATPTKAEEMRVFDLTATVGLSGDALVLAIPDTLQLHGSNPLNAGVGHTGLGLNITVTPMNAAAVGASPAIAQDATTVTLTFTGPSVAPPGSSGAAVASDFFGLASNGGTNPANDYTPGTIAAGAPMYFPQNGNTTGAGAVTANAGGAYPNGPGSLFTCHTAGLYQITWETEFSEASQLALWINGARVGGDAGVGAGSGNSTASGSGAGTQQNNHTVLINLAVNDTIALMNDHSSSALTPQPIAGGTKAIAQTIGFVRLGGVAGGAAGPATYRVVMSSMHSLIR